MHDLSDTIAAIATGGSPAALGIIRISGPLSADILKKVVPSTQKRLKPRHVTAGVALHPDTHEMLDEVVCFYCPGPGTATGDDTAEIQGHGGPVVMNQLLSAALFAGARPAEPGEFTYRAFANGRMNLTQAEAVMSLIGARSERAARVAMGQLSGALGQEIEDKFNQINGVSAHLEAGLDFPDEDLPLEMATDLANRLYTLLKELQHLANTFTLGSRLGDGASIAIVGPPNAGKSSLFNALLGDDRAIVDPDPGTTRDVVEARSEIAGIPVVYFDTAGQRESDSRVEQAGIEKSNETMREADVVLLVLDGASSGLFEEASRFETLPPSLSGADLIVVLNKNDLSSWHSEPLPKFLQDADFMSVSAQTGNGIDTLKKNIGRALEGGQHSESIVLTTARQHRIITETISHIDKAQLLLRQQGELELAALEMRWSRDKMAALLGRSATEEMLTMLFSEFCIGK